MNKLIFKQAFSFRRLAMLAALFSATAPALAAEGDEVDRLTNPKATELSFELGSVSRESQRFSMYNGLENGSGVGIGSLNFIRRNDDGVWFRASGRDLGISTAELHAEFEDQGDWRVAIDYGQTPRVSPYEIHTNLRGIGTNSLSYTAYNATAATAVATMPVRTNATGVSLETNRYATKLDLSRNFGKDFLVWVKFQNEVKHGARIFGRGTTTQGASLGAMEFLAEPVDTTTRQLEVALDYTGEKLQLSGGYYGTWFSNQDGQLNIAGGASSLACPAGSGCQTTIPYSVMALPPDNFSHQLNLTGAYQFTESTRGNFKLSRTRAEQTDDFASVPSTATGAIPTGGLNRSGRTDLGGLVETTLAQVGVTSHPMPKLDIVANLRYEDRDDKTKVAKYITPTGTTSATDGFNEPRSLRIESGKFEAAYQLPQGFRLTGGVDAERKERTMEGVRIVGYRERTEEMSYRLELRRMLAETLSGSVGYVRSDRTGSDYRVLRNWNTTTNAFNTTTPAGLYAIGGLLQPFYLADRDRNKLKMSLDWAPTDKLSVQFNAEGSRDDYGSGLQSPDVGVGSGKASLVGFDASYSVNDNWKLSAWGSHSYSQMKQETCTTVTTGATVATRLAGCIANTWSSSLSNRVDSLGLGFRGKIRSKVDVGGDLTLSADRSTHDLAGAGSGVTAADMPDINTHQTTLKLFAGYNIAKESSVRLDYTLDHRKTNDWTWKDWTYSDGTWVDQHPVETVQFVGVSYRYGFK